MGYFAYCGKKISYEDCGSGEPLVLLHGNTVSSSFFCTDCSTAFGEIPCDNPGLSRLRTV